MSFEQENKEKKQRISFKCGSIEKNISPSFIHTTDEQLIWSESHAIFIGCTFKFELTQESNTQIRIQIQFQIQTLD